MNALCTIRPIGRSFVPVPMSHPGPSDNGPDTGGNSTAAVSCIGADGAPPRGDPLGDGRRLRSRPSAAARRARSRHSPVGAWLGALFVAAALAAPGDLVAQSASGRSAPALAELEWLAGAWVLERPGEHLEERWSGPVGNSMVGHFRWIRGGELWITELVSITEEEDGSVLFRLRHFGAEMTPWEAEDDPFTYRLTESEAGRATFTIIEPRPGRPHRFTFMPLPGDSLLVRLEGEEDGRPSTQDFRYGRRR